MNEEQIATLEWAWARLRGQSEALGRVFFARLFELDESMRTRFVGSHRQRLAGFVAALERVVGSLTYAEGLRPEMRRLARRPAVRSLGPAGYRNIGKALSESVREALGTDWDEEVRAAISTAFALVSRILLKCVQRYSQKQQRGARLLAAS